MSTQAATTATFPPNVQMDELDEEEVFEFEQPDSYLSVTPLDQQVEQIHTPANPDPERARQMIAAHQAPRCRHIKASGIRCGAPALRDGDFCYFHNHTHNGARLIYPSLSRLEDGHGIQVALMEVLTGILDGRLEHKTGALLLYGLQTAACNLKHMPDIDPDQITTGEPEAEDGPTCDPQGEAAAAAEVEKAAAADGVRSAWQQLGSHHHIPSRASGNTAQDARFAETIAEYYRYDPDAPVQATDSGARTRSPDALDCRPPEV